MRLSDTCANAGAAATRRQAFVDAARSAFFAHGYAGASMSSIASAVGGSKTTLWTCFPSKQDLFAAVVDDLMEQYGVPLSMDLPLDEPVTEVLARYAQILMSTLMAGPMLDLYRLVVGEAGRFPQLAETFYDRGPKRGKERLAAYFAEQMARGVLREGSPPLAVSQFVGLCQSARYQLAMLDLGAWDDPESQREELLAAVETFWHFWRRP